MRRPSLHQMALGIATLALVVAAFSACDDATNAPNGDAGGGSSSGGEDGSTTPADTGASSGDGGGTADGGGDCAGADPATVQALAAILGGWRWASDISGGTETDLSECDQTIGYFIGPDVASADYASCAIARGAVIPLRGGNYASSATGCTRLACSSMGLLMTSAKSASVFALGAGGKPTGPAVFYFVPIANATMSGIDLVQANTAATTNGKRMVRKAGVPLCN